MIRVIGISATAFGMAMLVGSAGCTRTPDGSVVLRKPAMLNRVLGTRDMRVARPQFGPPIYARADPWPPPRSPAAKPPRVATPAISLTTAAPFRRAEPEKPLSCRNETTPTGRIRIVCI